MDDFCFLLFIWIRYLLVFCTYLQKFEMTNSQYSLDVPEDKKSFNSTNVFIHVKKVKNENLKDIIRF